MTAERFEKMRGLSCDESHLRFDIEQVANLEISCTLKYSFYGCPSCYFAPQCRVKSLIKSLFFNTFVLDDDAAANEFD